MRQSETGLFLPYRAFGDICSSVKPAYEQISSEKFQGLIYCPVGNVVCVYTFEPFRLIFITKPLSFDIHFVGCTREYMFAANENSISIFKQVGKEFLYDIVIEKFPKLLLPFAEALIVVDNEDIIHVIDICEGRRIVEIESPAHFSITSLVHPITYINQVVAGGSDGRMRILDIEEGRLVREFPCDHNFNCAITVLEQSPAVDVLGVGLANGQIHLRNIKVNQVICSFRQDGSITTMAFRTDGIDSLITGNSDGSLAVWDLNNKMLIGQKTDVHQGPVVSLCFLLGQSFLISSGEDNRLVKWVLKDEYSLPELRKRLEGPSQPVSAVSFYGSRSLLVASRDGFLRKISSYDRNNMKHFGAGREVSGRVMKKRFGDVRLPPILRMSINKTREAVWDDVICLHERSPMVSSWSTRRFAQGSHIFSHERFKEDPKYVDAYATSAILSCCGNFAIIGYSSGHLDVFNMQSRRYQRSFGSKSDKQGDLRAHSSAVTGIVLDMMNENLVSGSSDGYIHFWSFNPPELLSKMVVSCGVSRFRLDRYNSLLAIALDNGDVAVVDVLCRRVARNFKNAHSGCELTALEFSHDGKWLVSADNKCIIKVWDLSTSSLLDIMKCPHVCLDVSFNETGQYLVTCHEGMRAVYFWANKNLFYSSFSPSVVVDKPEFARECSLPGLSASKNLAPSNMVEEEEGDDESCRVVLIDEEEDDEDSEMHSLSSYTTLMEENEAHMERRQIEPHLLSLSGLAPSRWSNLPNLSLIRQRNKPVEPPKKLNSAPFFLPAAETLDGFVFVADEETEKENLQEVDKKTLMAKRNLVNLETPWVKSLMNTEHDSNKFVDVFVALKEMNVSSIDFQIRTLDTDSFIPFLNMLVCMLELRQDFELVQSYLATFLNIHYEKLWSFEEIGLKGEDEDEERGQRSLKILEANKELTEVLEKVLFLQENMWTEMQNVLDSNSSLSMWVKCSLIH